MISCSLCPRCRLFLSIRQFISVGDCHAWGWQYNVICCSVFFEMMEELVDQSWYTSGCSWLRSHTEQTYRHLLPLVLSFFLGLPSRLPPSSFCFFLFFPSMATRSFKNNPCWWSFVVSFFVFLSLLVVPGNCRIMIMIMIIIINVNTATATSFHLQNFCNSQSPEPFFFFI